MNEEALKQYKVEELKQDNRYYDPFVVARSGGRWPNLQQMQVISHLTVPSLAKDTSWMWHVLHLVPRGELVQSDDGWEEYSVITKHRETG